MPDKPRFPIRRFDVFAEYNRIKNEAVGMPEDQAKGRGIWLAKVVAGRRGGASAPSGARHEDGKKERDERKEEKSLSVGGEPQTDATFDHDIGARMGKEFYHDVLRPAIDAAFKDGKRYEDIRHSVRKEWK